MDHTDHTLVGSTELQSFMARKFKGANLEDARDLMQDSAPEPTPPLKNTTRKSLISSRRGAPRISANNTVAALEVHRARELLVGSAPELTPPLTRGARNKTMPIIPIEPRIPMLVDSAQEPTPRIMLDVSGVAIDLHQLHSAPNPIPPLKRGARKTLPPCKRGPPRSRLPNNTKPNTKPKAPKKRRHVSTGSSDTDSDPASPVLNDDSEDSLDSQER